MVLTVFLSGVVSGQQKPTTGGTALERESFTVTAMVSAAVIPTTSTALVEILFAHANYAPFGSNTSRFRLMIECLFAVRGKGLSRLHQARNAIYDRLPGL